MPSAAPVRRAGPMRLALAALLAGLVAPGCRPAEPLDATDAGLPVPDVGVAAPGDGGGAGGADAAADHGPAAEPEPEPGGFPPASPEPSDPQPLVEPPEAPFDAYLAAGLGRHLGRHAPVGVRAIDERTVAHDFAPTFDGPLCWRGEPFTAITRDGSGESHGRDLLVYLQPAGACWSAMCDALSTIGDGLPPLDVIDPDDPYNPFRDWDLTYVPGCDGSLFVGDADHLGGAAGRSRQQRGLANLSASLDIARALYPDARRVAIVGSSAGGYGAIAAAPLVRSLYPAAEIMVVQDGGLGHGRGALEPAFVVNLLDEFRALHLVPPDCPGCLDGGHLYGVVDWLLRADPSLRVAAISAVEDFIIATWFLEIGTDRYAEEVVAETTALAEAHPGRYAPYIFGGSAHTLLVGELAEVGALGASDFFGVAHLRDTVVDGVPAAWWLRWFIERDPRFGPVTDAR